MITFNLTSIALITNMRTHREHTENTQRTHREHTQILTRAPIRFREETLPDGGAMQGGKNPA